MGRRKLHWGKIEDAVDRKKELAASESSVEGSNGPEMISVAAMDKGTGRTVTGPFDQTNLDVQQLMAWLSSDNLIAGLASHKGAYFSTLY
jgi:aspartate-semialdehyde dehydrogenase